MRKPKVAIIHNPGKEGASELLAQLVAWLEDRGIPHQDDRALAPHETIRDAAVVVCLGGDGTLLAAAGHMPDPPVPLIGVNLGRLGFLTEVKKDEVFSELESFLAGKSRIEDRLMLRCRVTSEQSDEVREFTALNDIVVSREGLSRILRLDVSMSGGKFTSFSGDGVIVATPTGSTAYSLSAGGAVVHPSLEALIITPICPHVSSLRPLVVSGRERISIRTCAGGGDARAQLTVDGQEKIEIDDSFTAEVMRAPQSLKLVKSSRRNYFQMLRENFMFP